MMVPAPFRKQRSQFRKDRPSYAEMLRLSQVQGDLLTLEPEEESLDCACTDPRTRRGRSNTADRRRAKGQRGRTAREPRRGRQSVQAPR
jgi:hypothetical protein